MARAVERDVMFAFSYVECPFAVSGARFGGTQVYSVEDFFGIQELVVDGALVDG